MKFETEVDLARERKAIELFAKTFNLDFVKLTQSDVDYKMLDKEGRIIGYVEVKGRIRHMADAFPLPIALRKLVKLMDKHMKPIVVWACEDGIFYADITKIRGTVMFGGRTPRSGAHHDEEMMAYYDKQNNIRYIRFT